VRREQLEHVLRAACAIAKADASLVIGSQAILGSFGDDVLPEAAVRSVEVDVTFLDDPADERSDQVDGAIGELSQFHETFGYYAQGVSVTTAILPSGWQNRLVVLDTPGTSPGRGLCLEPHDLVVSKPQAGPRERRLPLNLPPTLILFPPVRRSAPGKLTVTASDTRHFLKPITRRRAEASGPRSGFSRSPPSPQSDSMRSWE
jgi:hypothetical protein